MTVTAQPKVGGLAGLPIVLTGATGFVGKRLLPVLLAEGADLTLLPRTSHGAERLRQMGAKVVVADLNDRPRVAAALSGARVLVHLAYDLRAPGAANLAAFRTLVAAAEGIPKIVHASSAVVYDAWPEGPLDETSPIGSAGGGGYRQAKIAMERMLMGRPGAAAVLQPTIVWGPGSQMWTEGPMNALRGGGLVVPEGCGICPALHVDDLVEALRLSVLAGGSGRERFLISGRARFRWEDLYAAYARRLGREAALFRQSAADLAARLGPEPEVSPDREDAMPLAARVSAGLRRVLGRDRFTHLSAAIGRLRPAGRPSYPDRFLLRLMLASPEISTRKAEEQLGFVARRGLDDGMATIKVE